MRLAGPVVELADTLALGANDRKVVKVRVLSGPPNLAHSGTLSLPQYGTAYSTLLPSEVRNRQ
jgi:hypothetical protein